MAHHPLRVLSAGGDTTIETSLCSTCPHGPSGCCAAPPRIAFADIARIVRHGGRDWLLAEIAAGRLVAKESFLNYTRPNGACVYVGPRGCTIPHDRRSATCNYYVCESSLEVGGETASQARITRDRLEAEYARRDETLAAKLKKPIVFDAPTLDILAAELGSCMIE